MTDRRYERFVKDQLPDAGLLIEPMGRNTAAAIALATVAIDRPHDEVMLVVPADAHIDPARAEVYREVLRTAGEHLATGAFGIDDPLVTLGTQVTRAATEYGYLIPRLDRGDTIEGLRAYPLAAFEEKPKPARAEELRAEEGVAWNAGIFLWRRRAIRRELERFTSLVQLIEPTIAAPPLLQHAYEQLKPVSIDYAVMEGAARNGQVVMGSMDVGWSDLGSWTQLLAAIGAKRRRGRRPARRDRRGRPRRSRRSPVDGRLGVIAPLERGSMTAVQPIAVLRGAAGDRDRLEALIDRCAEPGG